LGGLQEHRSSVKFNQYLLATSTFSVTVVARTQDPSQVMSLLKCVVKYQLSCVVLKWMDIWVSFEWVALMFWPIFSSTCWSQVHCGWPDGRFQSATGGVLVKASMDRCTVYTRV